MRLKFVRLFAAIAIFVSVVEAAYGQETVNNASVSGRVTDPSGAVIQGARVSGRQTDTGITNVTSTGRDGRFRFPYLQVGCYDITVSHAGFAI